MPGLGDDQIAAAANDRTRLLEHQARVPQLLSRLARLVELAERVAEVVVTRFDVPRVRVRVEKPGAVRYSATVGVEVVRTREDYVE